MRKIVVLALFCLLCTLIIVCYNNEHALSDNSRFFKASEYSGDGCYAFVDSQTGVMYLFRKSGYSGGMTVMLDSDGKPLIYNK